MHFMRKGEEVGGKNAKMREDWAKAKRGGWRNTGNVEKQKGRNETTRQGRKNRGKPERINKEVDRMVMQNENGRRERVRTVYEFSPPHPSFSLIPFSKLFCSGASQRSGSSKSAPCSRSLLQMRLGCTQMNSTQSSYFTPTRGKHAKPDLWSSLSDQTEQAPPNLSTPVPQNSLMFIYTAITHRTELRNYTKCGKNWYFTLW